MNTISRDALDGRGKMTIKKTWSQYSIVFVFIILLVICTIMTNGKFGSWGNITTILRNASTIGIIDLGMTCVIISGGIDISCGSVCACAGTICF